MAAEPTSPLTIAVARWLGAEIDRQIYSHYRDDLTVHGLGLVLVDGDLNLLEIAERIIPAIDRLRRSPAAQPIPAQSIPAESPPTDTAVKPAEKPRR